MMTNQKFSQIVKYARMLRVCFHSRCSFEFYVLGFLPGPGWKRYVLNQLPPPPLSISDYLFQVDVKEKVSRANFIAILTDGTTDAAIIEQEVIYLLYLDPDNFVPRLSFFTVSELHQGQDAAMLKSAIVNAFTENNMEDALSKIVFFGSDGTWTNSGLKSGLITRLEEDLSGSYLFGAFLIDSNLQ